VVDKTAGETDGTVLGKTIGVAGVSGVLLDSTFYTLKNNNNNNNIVE
jgi:hypothetical protein